MKNNHSLSFLLAFSAAVLCAASSCSFPTPIPDDFETIPSTVTPSTVTPSGDTDQGQAATTSSQAKELITIDYTLNYYDIISDSVMSYSASESFEGEMPPEFFITKLSKVMQTDIAFNSVSIESNNVYIDFSSKGAPFYGTGSFEESSMLDSIAQAYLDNLDTIDNIFISCDGASYQSGHISTLKDSPYATKHREQHE